MNNKRDEVVHFAYKCLPFFGQPWLFNRWPTHRNIRGLRRVFSSDRTASVSSSNCTVTKSLMSWTYTCASSFVALPQWLYAPQWGSWIFDPGSSKNNQFIWTEDHVHCRSWIDYEFSRFWICSLSAFLSLWTFLQIPCCKASTLPLLHQEYKTKFCPNSWAKSHAALRAHRSCCKASSCDLFARVLALKDYAHEVHTVGQFLPMDTFFPDFFGAKCPWRIWRHVLIPIFLFT